MEHKKFISWNVNGIRACMKKGFEEAFNVLDADIFCIQETKMQEGQAQFDPEGYFQYWSYAEKKGYSDAENTFYAHLAFQITQLQPSQLFDE